MAESSAKLKKKQVDPLKRTVFSLALPIFFQSLLGLSLGYIDTIMLSNYNDIAVGAIGNANSILGFLNLAFNIISSATGVIVKIGRAHV